MWMLEANPPAGRLCASWSTGCMGPPTTSAVKCKTMVDTSQAIAGLTRCMSLAHQADVLQSRQGAEGAGTTEAGGATGWRMTRGPVRRTRHPACQPALQLGCMTCTHGRRSMWSWYCKRLHGCPWMAKLFHQLNKLQHLELVNRIDAEAGTSRSGIECGLHLLSIEKISGCQFHIESLVAEARQLQLERDCKGLTCKETRHKAKAQVRKLLQAKEELLSKAEWQVLGTSQQPASVRLLETVISSMVSGSAPPWTQYAASPMASTLHHGKRFFQLYSDQERIAEQQVILRQELSCLQTWLLNMLEACTRSSAALNPSQHCYVEQHKAWFASKLEHASQLQWDA
ncbi:hypothetical protein HaLaN_13960, partial [Haematococcus lacustris]